MYQEFISELYSSPIAITINGLNPYLPSISQFLLGAQIADNKPELKLSLLDALMNGIDKPDQPDNENPSVAIIRLNGMMSKFGSWFDYGTEEYAHLLDQAYADDSIKAVVMPIHSVGGTVHSVFPMEAAIKRRNKPVLAVVDSNTKSAAYYIASLCDRVYATNRMSEVGSIGVMAQMMNADKMHEKEGIKVVTIIPPESKWKNKAFMEALKGKTDLYIKEELTPWALHFQDIVKQNRPNLKLSVDGLLEGREFYAYDAIDNGLIDEIKPFTQIVKDAFTYNQDQLNQFLK